MQKLTEFLLKETPGHADELFNALNTSVEAIANTRVLLNDIAAHLVQDEKYDEISPYRDAVAELNNISSYIGEIIEGVEIKNKSEEDTDSIIEEDENAIEEEIEDENEIAEGKVDYTKYLVDQTIPYKITENFVNTSPCAFSLDGEKYLTGNWYEITIKVCEILYTKNQKLFNDIVGSCGIKGRKNVYVAFIDDYPARTIMKKVKLLDTNIVVEKQLSANQHMIVVKRLLDKYKIPRTAISIFLESDRKPKHGQVPIGKYLNGMEFESKKKLISETDNDEQAEKKIGEYVREYFTNYFLDTTKQYDLKNFLNKYWCNDNFGICYPLIKEVDITKSISDQKNYNNEYARFWTKPVLQINGKHYILCSQWFRGFQEKFDEWVDKQNPTLVSLPNMEESIIDVQKPRKKENCNFYDFKKDECMCTESGVFTQPCNSLMSCPHYSEFKVYVVPKIYCKKHYCPCCNGTTVKELITCTYSPNGFERQNKLITYRCNKCEKNYIADSVYKGYTQSKSLEDLNVSFAKMNLV